MADSRTEYTPFTQEEDADLSSRRFRDVEALTFEQDLARRTAGLFEKIRLHLWDRPRTNFNIWRRGVRREKEFNEASEFAQSNRRLQSLRRQLEEIRERERNNSESPRQLDGIVSSASISLARRKDRVINDIRALEKTIAPNQNRFDRNRRIVGTYENRVKDIVNGVNSRIDFHMGILQERVDFLQANKNRLVKLMNERSNTIQSQKDQLNSLETMLASSEYDPTEDFAENEIFEENREIVRNIRTRIREGQCAISNLHRQINRIDRSLDRIAENNNYWRSFSNNFSTDSELDSNDINADPMKRLSPDFSRSNRVITEIRTTSKKIDMSRDPTINRLFESFAYFFDSSFNDIRRVVTELTSGIDFDAQNTDLRAVLDDYSRDILPITVGDYSVNLKESNFRNSLENYLAPYR